MLAIMGASGAGKTTLLSILSQKADPKLRLEGEVLANNTSFSSSSFYNFGVYVYQNDILHASLTVRGTCFPTQKPFNLQLCSNTTTLWRPKPAWMSWLGYSSYKSVSSHMWEIRISVGFREEKRRGSVLLLKWSQGLQFWYWMSLLLASIVTRQQPWLSL